MTICFTIKVDVNNTIKINNMFMTEINPLQDLMTYLRCMHNTNDLFECLMYLIKCFDLVDSLP